MSETTYPRLPLADVPGYTPDGPVWVDAWPTRAWIMRPGDDSPGASLILDPTGAASLARAVAARVGLDVSGGVTFGGGLLSFGIKTADGERALWRNDDETAPAGLRDATDTLSALAIVARAVLT